MLRLYEAMLSQAVAMLCVCCALLGQALSKTQIPTCPMISDDISPLYSHYIPTISPLYPCCIPVVSYYIISISIIIITSLHHYIITSLHHHHHHLHHLTILHHFCLSITIIYIYTHENITILVGSTKKHISTSLQGPRPASSSSLGIVSVPNSCVT